MKNKNMMIIKKLFLGLMVFTSAQAMAQLNPLASQYFVNPYIANPAYAGQTEGLKISGTYRKLWGNVSGAPVIQNFTADYRMGKVGLGLNVNNEAAGLLNQTRTLITYAYHLPLNDESDWLHFGISAGVTNFRIRSEDIVGNPNDILVGRYNQRKGYLDGDFGAAFTSERLEVQAAVPNLKNAFNREAITISDATSLYTAVSYRIGQADGSAQLQPKIAYRSFRNYQDIVDIGAQLSFADQQVLLSGMYHTSQSATFGVGMNFRKQYLFYASYTTETSSLNTYTNGTFELNLRLQLYK